MEMCDIETELAPLNHIYEEIPDLDHGSSRSNTPSSESCTIIAEHDGKPAGSTRKVVKDTKCFGWCTGSKTISTGSDLWKIGSSFESHVIKTGSLSVSTGSAGSHTGNGILSAGSAAVPLLSPVDGAVRGGTLTGREYLECVRRTELRGGVQRMDRKRQSLEREAPEQNDVLDGSEGGEYISCLDIQGRIRDQVKLRVLGNCVTACIRKIMNMTRVVGRSLWGATCVRV